MTYDPETNSYCIDDKCVTAMNVGAGAICLGDREWPGPAVAGWAALQSARDAETRKQHPVATGVLDYFPDAIKAIAHVSYVGNEQHNPGTPLHWDRAKSADEADALMRHFLERGTLDTDGLRHTAKMAWRALALLQKEIEAAR